MKPQMPFPSHGGCYAHVGDELVPLDSPRVAIGVRADGNASGELTGDGTGAAAPEVEQSDTAVIASTQEREADGAVAALPPIEYTDAPPRRRK